MRLNGQARVLKHLLDCTQGSGRGNRRAADQAHIALNRVGISSDAHKLIHEVGFTHAGAQTSRLLEGAHIDIGNVTLHTHADSQRNRSAVALRRRSQRIANRLAGLIFCDEELLEHSVRGIKSAEINLFKGAAREHRTQSLLLCCNLLLLNGALRHLVGDAQGRGCDECEEEQTKCKFANITHSS